MLSLEKIDGFLKIFMFFLFLPIAGIFWSKPDTNDLLSYFSFVLSVSGAVYAGRGVFSSKEMPNSDSDPQKCFLTSLLFIGCAALCLLPILYKKHSAVLVWVIVIIMLVLSLTCIVVVLKEYIKDEKHPFLRGIVPVPLIVFNIVVLSYVISHYELLTG